MALDLLRGSYGVDETVPPVDAAYLVARLCEEARICLDPEPLQNDQQTLLTAATYQVDEGLTVKDGYTGKRYRLRVIAEEIK